MKKKVLLSLLVGGASAVALTGCGDNNEARVKKNENNIATIQEDVKTLQSSLDSAKEELQKSIDTINTLLDVEKIAAKGDAISKLNAEIVNVTTNLTKLKTDSEAALTAAITEVNAAIEATDTSLAEKEAALQAQITAINTAIGELDDTYSTDEELAGAVATLNATITQLTNDATAQFSSIDTQIATINGDIDTLEADLLAVKNLIGEIKKDETTGEAIAIQTQIDAIVEDVNTLKTTYATKAELTELQTAFNDAKNQIFALLGTVKIDEETGNAIPVQTQIDAANSALETFKTYVSTTYATIAALEALDENVGEALENLEGSLGEKLEALENSLSAQIGEVEKDPETGAVISLQSQITTLKTALNSYIETASTTYATTEALSAAVETLVTTNDFDAAIGQLKVDEETGEKVSLQTQITALENAKATIAALNELQETFDGKYDDLDAKIADLQAQIGEVAKDEETGEVIASLQAQIADLQAQIGTVSKDMETGEVIASLQDQIDEIKAQIGDFSGSAELTKIKADLNKKLSNAYADFQDLIEDYRDRLENEYHQDVKNLFKQISRSFNHEMTGYLYEGMTYITLAKNATDAEKYEEEYELLIGNFINPALFEISKQFNLAYIKDIEKLPNIGDLDETTGEPKEETIRNKYYQEVKAVEWFSDEEVEALKETPEEYRDQTNALIAKMKLSTNKAEAIDDFLGVYNAEVEFINTRFADPTKYNDETAPEEFIALLETIKDDLSQYDNCTNAEIDYVDPTTGKSTKITDLEDQLKSDVAKMNIVHNEAVNYLSANKFASDNFDIINNNLAYISNVDKAAIKAAIYDVIDLEDYATLTVVAEVEEIDPETGEPIVEEVETIKTDSYIDAHFKADKEAITLIKNQATSYNSALKYAAEAIATIEDLEYITKPLPTPDGTSEQEKIIALINAIVDYDDYIGNDGTVVVDGEETAKHVAQLKANKNDIDIIVDQATKYNAVRGYAIDRNIVELEADVYGISYTETETDFIGATDRVNINNLINAVPNYDNYLNNYDIDEETGTYEYLSIYTSDKADLDAYESGIINYNNILMYVSEQEIEVNDILNEFEEQIIELEPVQVDVTPVQKAAERETIITLMRAIPDFDNYFDLEKNPATQYASDTAKADLLVTRADVFDKIYDAIKGDVTGLETYINSLESGYLYDHDNNPETDKIDRFTDALKEKFIEQFTYLALASNYDTAVAEFETTEAYTNYKDAIIGTSFTDGFLEIVKKRAEIYCDVLKIVNEAEDYLNSDHFNEFTDSYNDYNQIFINRFIGIQEYAKYMATVENFTTTQDFDVWKADSIDALDDLIEVAEYENTLLSKLDEVQTAIEAAWGPKLTEAERDYLFGVTYAIYDNYTSVTRGDTTVDPVVVETTWNKVDANAFDAPKTQLNAVKSAITTIYNADTAIDTLDDNIDNYILAQRTQFLNKYYKYRDDEEFGETHYHYDSQTQTATGDYGFFNQAALTAWNFYKQDLYDKANGNATKEIEAVKYSYTLPDEYDYATFTDFITELETPAEITARYNTYTLWYSKTNTGMVYTITAKYRELDGKNLEGARAYFIAQLNDAYEEALAETSTQKYREDLISYYEICLDNINDTYGATTTKIIDYYVDTIDKFAETVAADDNAYKANVILEYNAVYSTYQSAISDDDNTLSSLAIAHNDGLAAINAATSKEDINAAYAAQVTALTTIYRTYKTNKLELERETLSAKDATNATTYQSIYSAFVTALDEYEGLTKADIDTEYGEAITEFIATYKTSKKTQLQDLCDEYKAINVDDDTSDAAYQDGVDTYLALIDGATTTTAIDTYYDLGANSLLANYVEIVKAALDAEYDIYADGLDEVEDATLIANYQLAYDATIATIEAVTDPTKYATVTTALTDAKDAFLALFKLDLNTKLDALRDDYVLIDSASETSYNSEYSTGEEAILEAGTKAVAQDAYDTAITKFLPIFVTSKKAQLNTLVTSYIALDEAHEANYNAIKQNADTAIDEAADRDAVVDAFNTADEALFAIYQGTIETKLTTLYAADLELIEFDGMDDVLEGIFDTAYAAIEDADDEATVTGLYDAAAAAMALVVYQDGELVNLNTIYVETYGETPANVVKTEYNKGVAAIKAATTETAVDAAYDACVVAMATVDLAYYKETKTADLKTASDAGAVSNSTFVTEYNAAYADGEAAINAATTKDAVTTAYNTWYETITNLVINYKNNLKTGENSLKTKYDSLVASASTQAEKDALLATYNSGCTAINNAVTKADINSAYADGIVALDFVAYQYSAIAALKTLYEAYDNTDLEDAYNTGVTNILAATNKDAVDSAQYNAAFAMYKRNFVTELTNLKTELAADASTSELTALTAAYNDGVNSVNAATNESLADMAKSNAVTAMNACVKTLEDYKDAKIDALDDLDYNLSNDSDLPIDELQNLSNAYNSGCTAINSALDKTNVDTAYSNAVTTMNSCIATFTNYQTAKVTALETIYETYGENPYTAVTNAYNNGLINIADAETKVAVYTAYNAAVNAMYKAKYISLLETERNAYKGYGEEEENETEDSFNAGIANITDATTSADVQTAYNNAVSAMLSDYKELLQERFFDAYEACQYENYVVDEYDAGVTAINTAATRVAAKSAYESNLALMLNADYIQYRSVKVFYLTSQYESYMEDERVQNSENKGSITGPYDGIVNHLDDDYADYTKKSAFDLAYDNAVNDMTNAYNAIIGE